MAKCKIDHEVEIDMQCSFFDKWQVWGESPPSIFVVKPAFASASIQFP